MVVHLLHTETVSGSSPLITTKFCKCQQEKDTLEFFFEEMNSVKQREARILSKNIRDVGQVFQVTYRVPLEFITRVNGCYNDGATTYKFNLLGYGVMVTQRALNSLSLVRFQVSLPNLSVRNSMD